MSVASVPSQAASLSSASVLARTLEKAREAPLCVPQRRMPRRTRVLDARILIQAQEAVRAEVDHRPAADLDVAVGADAIDDQVFQVGRREQLGEMLDEANQAVLPQRGWPAAASGRSSYRTFFSTLWGITHPACDEMPDAEAGTSNQKQ